GGDPEDRALRPDAVARDDPLDRHVHPALRRLERGVRPDVGHPDLARMVVDDGYVHVALSSVGWGGFGLSPPWEWSRTRAVVRWSRSVNRARGGCSGRGHARSLHSIAEIMQAASGLVNGCSQIVPPAARAESGDDGL